MVMRLRNSSYLIFFLTVFIISCKEKSTVNNELPKELFQNEKDSIVKENNFGDTVEVENKFIYPKTHLFLNFYSGMTKKEFIIVADSLVERKILYKKSNSVNNDIENVYFYNVSKQMNWPDQIQYGICLNPKFDDNNKLLMVKLNDIGLFSNLYSSKYGIPKWSEAIIQVSKIGKYNTSYDPLDHITSISESEQSKMINDKFYTPKRQRLSVPKSFKDKSRTLNLYETQTYYKREVNQSRVKNFKKVIDISENAVMIYEKNWSLKNDIDYSIPVSQIPFEARFDYINLRERQSKQLIEKIYWEMVIDVTYTTFEYYKDSQPKYEIIIKEKEDIDRNINDEI